MDIQKRPDIKIRFHELYRHEKNEMYNTPKEAVFDEQLLSRQFDQDIDEISITEYDRLALKYGKEHFDNFLSNSPNIKISLMWLLCATPSLKK